jgi:hypothetical protein
MSKPNEKKELIMDYGYYQECKRKLVIERAELFNYF